MTSNFKKRNSKIYMFVNVDWFYLSHRAKIAKKILESNISFKAFAEITSKTTIKERKLSRLYESPIKRSKTSLYRQLKSIICTFILLLKDKPSIVHGVTIKPIIILGLLTAILRINFVASVSGLGPGFSADNRLHRMRKSIIVSVYRLIFYRKNSVVICQSARDVNQILQLKIAKKHQIKVIKSSGVNTDKYFPTYEKNKKIKILMASRLLKEKGVKEYISVASNLLKDVSLKAEFFLAGDSDPESPTSYSEDEVGKLVFGTGVTFMGHVSSLEKTLQSIDLFVLPSYYPEGVPKVLIEAAASGCAIITTDHAGCSEAIVPNITGLLVKPWDEQALYQAIKYLISNKHKFD